MKVQTGVRIDSEVWRAYRVLCSREKQRPSLAIEEFLRLVLENDSVLRLLSLMRDVAKSRVEGFDAYARVLLDWYTHEKYWFSVNDSDASVEALLLDSLKVVTDAELRQLIENALVAHQRKIHLKKKGASEVDKNNNKELEVKGDTKKAEDVNKIEVKDSDAENEIQQKLNELKRFRKLVKHKKEN
jgi:hypothetical protein